MEFRALAAELKKGPAAVYLVYGAETYLAEQAVELIRATDPGFQVLRFPSSETTWSAVETELFTLPLTGGRKLAVVMDEGSLVRGEAEALKAYAAAPAPGAVLVVRLASEKAPPVPESGAIRHVLCRPLRSEERVRWVQSEFQRRGRKADPAAAEALAEASGASLAVLAGHIERLALYLGDRPRVSREDVAALVNAEPEHEVYELALAAASKKAGRALEIVHRLLRAGEPPPRLLWRIALQYRLLVEAKKMLLAGKRRFEVTSALGITYYPDEFLALVEAHDLEELLEKHGAILAADVALKTSGGQDVAIMEGLVLRLAMGRAPVKAATGSTGR